VRGCDRGLRCGLTSPGGSNPEALCVDSLRHGFTTAIPGNAAAITDLQGLLGHQSVSTTQIYAGMVDKRARSSLEALGFGT